jgi:hypothetical protein
MRPKDSGTSVFSVDLKGHLRKGARESFMVHSGDVVFVTGRSALGMSWAGLMQLTRDLASVVIIVDYFRYSGRN